MLEKDFVGILFSSVGIFGGILGMIRNGYTKNWHAFEWALYATLWAGACLFTLLVKKEG